MMTPSSLQSQHHRQAAISQDINMKVYIITERWQKMSDCNETLCEAGGDIPSPMRSH